MDEVRLAKIFWMAEHLGGAFYDRFATGVDNADVGGTFAHFATDEHEHATTRCQDGRTAAADRTQRRA